ncbi:putative F-box/LRR-repeat protein At4g13960 [Nicotiana sylvestris]|uniref:putative F-box/LRR-repeat protein At4g13960 n=1 Tax=Nicotiana sylvestris TaxID=4096 RepID=UPI00388C7AE3
MDQISQLPDPILQHILFFLPAKDAAQTSVLSRTWLNVWNLLPILTFDFDENAFIQKHLSAAIEEQKQADEGDAFLNHIDSPLTNLRIQKAIIQKFRLSLNFSATTVEDLSLVECRGVKDILISNLPNLLKLTLHQEDDIANENILIQAVNLQSLNYRGCNGELKFDVASFKFMKEFEHNIGADYQPNGRKFCF